MSIEFLESAFGRKVPKPALVEGYSETELVKLEKVYGISVTAQLRQLMLSGGRCLGGLLHLPQMYFYDYVRTAEDHIKLQALCRYDLAEEGLYEYLGKGEFFIASFSEDSIDYFVRTFSDKPDQVYIQNAFATPKVQDTGHDIISFIAERIKIEEDMIAEVAKPNSLHRPHYERLLQLEDPAPKVGRHYLGVERYIVRGDMLKGL